MYNVYTNYMYYYKSFWQHNVFINPLYATYITFVFTDMPFTSYDQNSNV